MNEQLVFGEMDLLLRWIDDALSALFERSFELELRQ